VFRDRNRLVAPHDDRIDALLNELRHQAGETFDAALREAILELEISTGDVTESRKLILQRLQRRGLLSSGG
jgi:hypothetical protein